jgi:hypothetical protein
MPEFNTKNLRQSDYDADFSSLRAANNQLLARIAELEKRVTTQAASPVVSTSTYTPPPSSSGLTSVSLALPSIFTVDNSPLTSNGVITATLASQSANLLWASPDGSSGSPSFRSMALADIPNLLITGAKIASSTIAIGKLSATGSPSSTTFLRGDDTWAVPASSNALSIVTASGTTYTIGATNDVVVSTNASDITVTLVSAASFGARRLTIKRTQTGQITATAGGGDTVDGSASYSKTAIIAPFACITLISDGANAWYIQ